MGDRLDNTPSESVCGIVDFLEQRSFIRLILSLGGGSLRFNELIHVTDTNSNTLAHRLRLAGDLGLVSRDVVAYMPPHVTYELPPVGHWLRESLECVVNTFPANGMAGDPADLGLATAIEFASTPDSSSGFSQELNGRRNACTVHIDQ